MFHSSSAGDFKPAELLNLWLTNYLPRYWSTRFMAWFSRIEIPLIKNLSLKVWRFFDGELNLEEARQQHYSSLHEIFIRELKPDARKVDHSPDVVISPCDAIVGSFGSIEDGILLQVKGMPYSLQDLLQSKSLVNRYLQGQYVTLRLKSSMYHRFHAPCDCRIDGVSYISGDSWNVNPATLKRIPGVFCKNERVVIDLKIDKPNQHITLVPVAAILVAGIQMHCLPDVLDLAYRGPNQIACEASFKRGQEMGYFQHGSTILLFASGDYTIHPRISEGMTVRMGEPLLSISQSNHH